MDDKILVHKVHGICKITEELVINGEDFLKASAIDNTSLVIYCPKNKKDLFFRGVVSFDEANKILDYMKNLKGTKIEPTKKQRTELYEKLYNGNLYDLAYLNIALLRYQVLKSKKKQGLSAIETKVLKAANLMLTEELSLSLNKSIGELNVLIKEWANQYGE